MTFWEFVKWVSSSWPNAAALALAVVCLIIVAAAVIVALVGIEVGPARYGGILKAVLNGHPDRAWYYEILEPAISPPPASIQGIRERWDREIRRIAEDSRDRMIVHFSDSIGSVSDAYSDMWISIIDQVLAEKPLVLMIRIPNTEPFIRLLDGAKKCVTDYYLKARKETGTVCPVELVADVKFVAHEIESVMRMKACGKI